MDAQNSAIGVLVRMFMKHVGLGRALMQRVEIVTPANNLMQVQEGVQLLRLHVSPYAGSNFHLPPLLLTLASLPLRLPALSSVSSAVVDVATAYLLDCITRACLRRSQADHRPHMSGGLQRLTSLTYLWHPFNILSCIAGSSSTYDSFFICLAIFGAITRNAPLAAFGLAAASYLTMHPVLLLVPLAVLIATGPEDLTPNPSTSTSQPASTTPASILPPSPSCSNPPGQLLPSDPDTPHPSPDPPQPLPNAHPLALPPPPTSPPSHPPSTSSAASLLLWFATWCALLALLSDISIRSYPQHMCLLPHLPAPVLRLLPSHMQWAPGPPAGGAQPPPGSSCWMRHTYGFLLDVTDHTPNIGFFWYFFQEMFPNFRAFFKFVFHSHSVIFLLPLAITLPHRPLFLTFAQLMIGAMFKPYPAVGDLALYTSLLPLFSAQLQHSTHIMFLLASVMLLLVLGPAMWHQWIITESANANFFYSITLLFGLWQTMLFAHILSLTLRLDQRKEAPSSGGSRDMTS